jgi:hypothetical protein
MDQELIDLVTVAILDQKDPPPPLSWDEAEVIAQRVLATLVLFGHLSGSARLRRESSSRMDTESLELITTEGLVVVSVKSL